MKIILEQNGTPAHVDMSEQISDLLTFDLGHKVEQVVGGDDLHITLYNNDREVIARFREVPTLETLSFYIRLSETEE